ncbi:TEL2, telomere maintenance protein 2 [Clydaea vesicula]|uniref:TEL2, telomere maintenance protein 2 n=1 Tax=Clydaea vesicula TaxID=447962 RepID=A0AAD5TWU1_9FUNG|nr:TEL2, telomere maintenance protein 2 [Clydaea vesicula]
MSNILEFSDKDCQKTLNSIININDDNHKKIISNITSCLKTMNLRNFLKKENIQLLISIPERTSQYNPPPILTKNVYGNWLATQLLNYLIECKNDNDLDLENFSELITKMLRVGYHEILVNSWFYKLRSAFLLTEDNYLKKNWFQIMKSLGARELDKFVTTFVYKLKDGNMDKSSICNDVQYLSFFLGGLEVDLQSVFNVIPELSFILGHKLLLNFPFNSIRISRILMEFIKTSNLKDFISPEECLKRLIKTWSDPNFIHHSSDKQHLIICSNILLFISNLRKEDFVQWIGSSYVSGVQHYLECGADRIRIRGMVLTEQFAKFNPTDEKLDFELKVTAEVEELRKLLIPLNEVVNGKVVDDAFEEKSQTENFLSEDLFEYSTKVPLSEKINPLGDSDDEDEFIPYEINVKNELEITPPKHLLECLSYIKSSENPEKIEAGLVNMSGLLRKAKKLDLDSYCGEICLTLHLLQDNFELKDFNRLKVENLVSCLVMNPLVSSRYLIEQFYHRNQSIIQRVEILKAISLAAWEMGSLEFQNSSTQNFVDSIVKKEISHIGKTIRKSSNINKKKKTYKNEFGPIASNYFFFPLVASFDSQNVGFNIFTDDDTLMVFENFIKTLSVILGASKNTIQCRQICREFFKLLKSLKFSNLLNTSSKIPKNVQIAILNGFLVCLDILDKSIVEKVLGDLSELFYWAVNLYQYSEDFEIKKISLTVGLTIQKINNSFQEEFFKEVEY